MCTTVAADRIHRVGSKIRDEENRHTQKRRKKETLHSSLFRLSMKHNPSLIASRLSSLRYSLRLMHREKAVPSYVTLLLPSTLFTRPLCSIAISVFFYSWILLYYCDYYYSFSAAVMISSSRSKNPASTTKDAALCRPSSAPPDATRRLPTADAQIIIGKEEKGKMKRLDST